MGYVDRAGIKMKKMSVACVFYSRPIHSSSNTDELNIFNVELINCFKFDKRDSWLMSNSQGLDIAGDEKKNSLKHPYNTPPTKTNIDSTCGIKNLNVERSIKFDILDETLWRLLCFLTKTIKIVSDVLQLCRKKLWVKFFHWSFHLFAM